MGGALRRWLVVVGLLGGALASAASPAEAHPHVWITATSELIYAPDGALSSVRHAWTFDDMYSSFAVQGLESKTKGVFSREELAPLAQTNAEALKEFHLTLQLNPTNKTAQQYLDNVQALETLKQRVQPGSN